MARNDYSNLTKAKIRYTNVLLMILFCIGFNGTISAQNPEGNKSTSLQNYLEKNAGSVLTQYYLDDPNDRIALQAMRYAMTMDSPEFSNLDSDRQQSIQVKLAECLSSINSINKFAAEGMSMKRAREKHYAIEQQIINTGTDQSASKMNDNGEPIVKVTATPVE